MISVNGKIRPAMAPVSARWEPKFFAGFLLLFGYCDSEKVFWRRYIVRDRYWTIEVMLISSGWGKGWSGWFATLNTSFFITCNHQLSSIDKPFWQIYQYLKLRSRQVLHCISNVVLLCLALQQQCCMITCIASLKCFL